MSYRKYKKYIRRKWYMNKYKNLVNRLKNWYKDKTYPEFKEWPKIPRLFREVIITEKIDGTNGQILVTEKGEVYAGSRNRWLSPESDNYGFHAWVMERKDEIVEKLGPGRHYGELWGGGR